MPESPSAINGPTALFCASKESPNPVDPITKPPTRNSDSKALAVTLLSVGEISALDDAIPLCGLEIVSVVPVPTFSVVDRLAMSPSIAWAIESATVVSVVEPVILPSVDFDADGERRGVIAVFDNNAPAVVALSVPLVSPERGTVSVSPATVSVDAVDANAELVASVVTSALMTTSSVGSTVRDAVTDCVGIPPPVLEASELRGVPRDLSPNVFSPIKKLDSA
jgi:hypothetical protein